MKGIRLFRGGLGSTSLRGGISEKREEEERGRGGRGRIRERVTLGGVQLKGIPRWRTRWPWRIAKSGSPGTTSWCPEPAVSKRQSQWKDKSALGFQDKRRSLKREGRKEGRKDNREKHKISFSVNGEQVSKTRVAKVVIDVGGNHQQLPGVKDPPGLHGGEGKVYNTKRKVKTKWRTGDREDGGQSYCHW